MINERFQIKKLIGEGRSKVFLCEDIEFPGKEFAFKCLPANAGENEILSFRDEYFILRKLDHPNIIKAYDIGTAVKINGDDNIEAGSKFISLEYFDGVDLLKSDMVTEENSLIVLIKQLCMVLYYLHQANFIYYDLKPENILVSNSKNDAQLKLIDMGLSEFIPERKDKTIKGSAQYIAPELLKNEPHDNRVDLYSMGILLYQIIYNRYPFDALKEIDIYKAQIETDFDFPESDKYSERLIKVVKKLLNKNPQDRYSNGLQILNDLEAEPTLDDYRYLMPAKVFSDREDAINILNNYINDVNSSEVFVIKGFDGAGKSSLLNQLFYTTKSSILIENTQAKSGFDLIKFITKKIIFSDVVYSVLSRSEIDEIASLIRKDEKDFLNDIQSVFAKITKKSKFILLFDDFNSYDIFTIEILTELIPIFQVNGIKIILGESSDLEYKSGRINNISEITIGSFTSDQLTKYVDLAYYPRFPKESLVNIILNYADLLPGNIVDFIRDIILLQIIHYKPDEVSISESGENLKILDGSLATIYDLRLSKLNNAELNLAKVLSAFEGSIDRQIIRGLLDITAEELSDELSVLQYHNIIQPSNLNTAPVVSSDGLKKHIYSLIDNREEFHLNIARSLEEKFPRFNKNELARQYELAGENELCYKVLKAELKNAEKLSAFSYMKGILKHLLTLRLDESDKNEIRFWLVETLSKLNNYKSALEVIEDINSELLQKDELLELYILKGNALIGTGDIDEGKELLKSLIPKVQDEYRKSKLLVEIAYAKFDLSKVDESIELCKELLAKDDVSDEDKGKVHNLLGMCSYYKDEGLSSAIEEFNKSIKYFKRVNLTSKIAASEVNLGTVYSILGNYKEAEEHWNIALKLNSSIGNLNQEGLLLLNNGIYYFEIANYEKAIEYYSRSYKIFSSLGYKTNKGLALGNLGEVYLATCEYQKAYRSLLDAKELFEATSNLEEYVQIILLLVQFYFNIGAEELLRELYEHLNAFLKKYDAVLMYDNEMKFIKFIISLLNKNSIDLKEIKSLSEHYLEKDDFKNFNIINNNIIEYLFSKGQFSDILKLIEYADSKEAYKQNNIYKAYKEYFCGKVSMAVGAESLSAPIEHLDKAYELLKNESITELTWKVLYELSLQYYERGSHKKSKRLSIYALEMIKLIAEKIEIPKFRKFYLQKEERKTALERLGQLQRSF